MGDNYLGERDKPPKGIRNKVRGKISAGKCGWRPLWWYRVNTESHEGNKRLLFWLRKWSKWEFWAPLTPFKKVLSGQCIKQMVPGVPRIKWGCVFDRFSCNWYCKDYKGSADQGWWYAIMAIPIWESSQSQYILSWNVNQYSSIALRQEFLNFLAYFHILVRGLELKISLCDDLIIITYLQKEDRNELKIRVTQMKNRGWLINQLRLKVQPNLWNS